MAKTLAALQMPLFEPESAWRPPALADLPSWEGARRIAIDCETRDPHLKELGIGVRRGGYITGVSFSIEDGPSHYLPIRHEGGDNLDERGVLAYLRDQGRVFKGDLVGANMGYDLDYLWEEGIEFPEVRYYRDIQVADPLIYELHDRYSLAEIAKRHGLPGKDEEKLREAARAFGVDPKGGMWRLAARYVGAYAEADTAQPLLILRRQERRLEEEDLWGIWNLESRVLPVLVKMRRRGVRVNMEKLRAIEEWSLHEEAQALQRVQHESGVHVQVGDVWKAGAIAPALEAIGITLNKTAQGQPNIDKDVLSGIDHPVAQSLGWARKVNKLRTTFAASVRRYEVNGRIHCTFNQIAREDEKGDMRGARYGRLSCVDPNLQQQPSRDEFAARWRSIYEPEEGSLWATNDYCFSDDTEVLTENGFKLFKDLRPLERVAQWSKGLVSWARPLAYQRVAYKGNMVHIHGERQTDLLVSPNHRCLLLAKDGSTLWCKAEDYTPSHAWYQPHAGSYAGLHPPGNADVLRVVAAIQADGSERSGNWRVWLKKPRKIERLRMLLQRAGLQYHETVCPTKPAGHGFVIARHTLIEQYLSAGKQFMRDSLRAANIADREAFLDELELWDGSTSGHYYCSTEEHNVNVVQELGVLTNRRCNKTSRLLPSGKILHSVTLTRRCQTNTAKFYKELVPYDGDIYCVTMPESTVIVRRNGRVSVTGQSQQEPRWTTHFAAEMDLPKAREAAQAYCDDPKLDNHDFMAQLTGLPRKFAKNVYLGLCYGEGGAKLSRDLSLPTRWALAGRWEGGRREISYFPTREEAFEARTEQQSGHVFEAAGEEAQEVLDAFDARAPFIKQLSRKATEMANKRGFVKTIGGRRLHFPRRNDGTYDWTHKALNRIIQGSSADQTKEALVELDERGYFIQLQVHDEIDCSVASIEEGKAIGRVMSEVRTAWVPFRVDTEIGPSWGEAEEIT